MTKLITRNEALSLGIKKYFTGKSCPHGHVSERFVSTRGCVACSKQIELARKEKRRPEVDKRREERHKEAKRNAISRAKKWASENKERRREIARDYYHRHKETILAECRRKTAENPKPRKPAKGRDPLKEKLRRQKWERKNREAKNAANRARRARNPELAREKEAAYRETHRAEMCAARKKWFSSNKEQHRCYVRKRRAIKASAEGSHSPDDIQRIREAQFDKCACCRVSLKGKGHVDHIVALSKGGSNWPRNLQLLCASCNTSKNAKDPIDFMRRRGRLL